MANRRQLGISSLIVLVFFLKKSSCFPYGIRPDIDFEMEPHLMTMRGFTEGDTGITDWSATGQAELERTLQVVNNLGEAKNVIFFLGDGMGVATTSAARIYKAQLRQLVGQDARLSFETWAHAGYSVTYNTDSITPDSAGTATAFLCGEKAKKGTVGVSQHVPPGDCTAQNQPEMKLKSILKHAMDEGKHTGIISTVRVTHATPSAAYSSAADRDWESDSDQPEDVRGRCPDIARQFIDEEYNQNIKVMMGGGRQKFTPQHEADPEYEEEYGHRLDERNLIQEWKNLHENMSSVYVRNQEEFDAVVPEDTDFLLGLFEPSHMHYEINRKNSSVNRWLEPSLSEMVEKAIRILQKGPNGYFLIVEGGNIDKAHHDNKAQISLNETVSLADAVARAREMTSEKDTLIVVTADHSHVMTINGYAYINSDVTGMTKTVSDGGKTLEFRMDDGKPHTILSYTNGPGYYFHRWSMGNDTTRINLTEMHQAGLIGRDNFDFVYDAAMPTFSETHGGEDVPLYANGPMSHLFVGVHEENYIAHAMMYAACIGPNKRHCETQQSKAASGKPQLLFIITALLAVLVNL